MKGLDAKYLDPVDLLIALTDWAKHVIFSDKNKRLVPVNKRKNRNKN